MNYIKEIFSGKPVDYIHGQFTRYGKGVFEGPMLVIRNGPTIRAIGSVHYVNALGSLIAENTSQEFKTKGNIYVKREIKIPVETSKAKNKKGLHSVEVKDNVHSDALKMIYGDYKDAYVLLNLAASEGKWKLTTKTKPPKPGGKLKENFCSAVLEASALDGLKDEVLFDVKGDFKTAEIKHEMTIEELVGSDELRKDAAKFRMEAKRKGKIKRTVTIDEKKTETIAEFSI